MVTYLVKTYNGYSYGDTLYELTEELGYRHRMTKAANRDGAFSDASLHDPRRVSGTGELVGAVNAQGIPAQDIASLRAAADAFKAAHQPGPPAPLMLDSDRYLNAQVERLSLKLDGLLYAVELSFLAYDPFWYAVASTTMALAQNAATAVTPGGMAKSLPIFTLVVSAAPTGSLITIANAQDVALTFAPPTAGTYTVDCLQERIVDQAGGDQTAYMTGDFLALIAGANQITLTLAGGVALSGQSVTWQDRWV